MDAKAIIAARAAQFLQDGDVVNLGIGLPEQLVNYLPEGIEIFTQAENGILIMGPDPTPEQQDAYIVNAGGRFVTVKPGASYFDSSVSFGYIRGGHVDKTVLGALQVDQTGCLASHIIPGKLVPGMGGAMDLVAGAKMVIIVTTHTAKGDAPKILKKCTLPLTAYKKVNWIVTELCVIEVTAEGLVVREIQEGITQDEIRAKTEADLIFPEKIGTF
jgi:acetate CoA/acetoacetate CoA-transferase beta subunit